jgi:hypothetical protein
MYPIRKTIGECCLYKIGNATVPWLWLFGHSSIGSEVNLSLQNTGKEKFPFVAVNDFKILFPTECRGETSGQNIIMYSKGDI